MSARAVRLLLLAIALLVAGCDQGTKRYAETSLDRPVTVVAGALELTHARNPGMAFSLERALPAPVRTPLLWTVGLGALAALGVAWWRRRGPLHLAHVGAAIIAGGAAGNVLDRVVRGHVVDWIHVRGWPVFNVADVALAVGAGLILLATWRAPRVSTS